MSTCSAPGCDREARVLKPKPLCSSHYQQHRRGRVLTPLGRPARVRLPGVLVTEDCAMKLEARGPTLYEATRDVLERWAKRKGQP